MVVTSRATQSEIRTALKHGVAGYLTSTSPANEVMDAVLNVQMGIRHVSGSLAIGLLDNVLNEQLTPRETDVLRLAAQGLANKVIAARLQVELGTIKCHMRGILEKLGASNRTEAVVIAHERGLLALAPVPVPVPVPFLACPGVQSSSASPACFRVAAPSVANGVGSEQAPLRSKPVWGTAYQ